MKSMTTSELIAELKTQDSDGALPVRFGFADDPDVEYDTLEVDTAAGLPDGIEEATDLHPATVVVIVIDQSPEMQAHYAAAEEAAAAAKAQPMVTDIVPAVVAPNPTDEIRPAPLQETQA